MVYLGADLNPLLSAAIGYGVVMLNGTLSVSAASSALTIAIKTAGGADPSVGNPVLVVFPVATGGYTLMPITAATSLVISSGSTLGVTSSTAFRLWITGFNDSGTFRLGVIKCSSVTSTGVTIYPLNDGLNSSTAEGGAGAADNSGVIYTGTAVTTKPMRILGYAEWSLAGLTAGTWTTTNLIVTQLFGPSIAKPGDIIQMVRTDVARNDSTSSGPFVATGTTATITPISAANPIEASVIGVTSCPLPTQISVQIKRGSTFIGGSRYSAYSNGAGGTATYGIASWSDWDFPNVITATTYTVFMSASVAGNTVTWGLGQVCNMILREVMG